MQTLPGYYTTTEAAEKLGYKDGTYLKTLCNSGKIPAYKVAKTWLIPEQWVNEQAKETPTGQGNRGITRKKKITLLLFRYRTIKDSREVLDTSRT